ncbi:uncharacterized protein LOC122021809 [Zingiber officinale]|uniref:uncharacterized protein LOC122021809 n=1 Tax=Zingiber officinale TaxID=94328 RepID=UPI001C4A78A5|nr:uncharacterized protein LOC122021809 [Zingiber officinale]
MFGEHLLRKLSCLTMKRCSSINHGRLFHVAQMVFIVSLGKRNWHPKRGCFECASRVEGCPECVIGGVISRFRCHQRRRQMLSVSPKVSSDASGVARGVAGAKGVIGIGGIMM